METKTYSHQFQINTLIIFPSIISLGLLITRIVYTGSPLFIFFVWNLFLAIIPFYISLKIKSRAEKKLKNSVKWLLLFLWLLFLPNAPYMITDLIHLKQRVGVPLWYDTLLILSFCWNGLIIGFISIYNVHEELKKRKGEFKSWVFILAVILLCGFGIYLGRYLRWNSWDILVNPLELFKDILNRIIHPFAHIRTWSITFSYSLFLIVGYLTIRSLIELKVPKYHNE